MSTFELNNSKSKIMLWRIGAKICSKNVFKNKTDAIDIFVILEAFVSRTSDTKFKFSIEWYSWWH